MGTLLPVHVQADGTGLEGPFFIAHGALCFSNANQVIPGSYAASRDILAVSQHHGLTVFTDPGGVYSVATAALVAAAAPDSEDKGLVPHNVASLDGRQLDAPALSQLSLSPDESILAAAAGDVIRVFVVADLIGEPGQQPQPSLPPATSWHLPSGATAVQLVWRHARQECSMPECSVLCASGQLLHKFPGQQLSPLDPAGAGRQWNAAAWSRDGELLALGKDSTVTICHPDCHTHFTVDVALPEVKDSGGTLSVNTVAWLGGHSVLIGASVREPENDGQVNSWAAMMVLQWGTWDHTNGMPPARSTLLEFFPTYTESAAPVGPDNLAALPVECLGLAVVSHRKAADNHLMVLECGVEAKLVDILNDRLAARIPLAPGDADNFVLGLGVDYTSTQVAVHHPLDPAEPDLPPSPVLVVATSDAKLHFYTLSHLQRPPPMGFVRSPTLPRRVYIPADAPLVDVPSIASLEGRADVPADMFTEVARGESPAVSDQGWFDIKPGSIKPPSWQSPPAEQWKEAAAGSDDNDVGVGRKQALVAGLDSDSDETVDDDRLMSKVSHAHHLISGSNSRATTHSTSAAMSERHAAAQVLPSSNDASPEESSSSTKGDTAEDDASSHAADDIEVSAAHPDEVHRVGIDFSRSTMAAAPATSSITASGSLQPLPAANVAPLFGGVWGHSQAGTSAQSSSGCPELSPNVAPAAFSQGFAAAEQRKPSQPVPANKSVLPPSPSTETSFQTQPSGSTASMPSKSSGVSSLSTSVHMTAPTDKSTLPPLPTATAVAQARQLSSSVLGNSSVQAPKQQLPMPISGPSPQTSQPLKSPRPAPNIAAPPPLPSVSSVHQAQQLRSHVLGRSTVKEPKPVSRSPFHASFNKSAAPNAAAPPPLPSTAAMLQAQRLGSVVLGNSRPEPSRPSSTPLRPAQPPASQPSVLALSGRPVVLSAATPPPLPSATAMFQAQQLGSAALGRVAAQASKPPTFDAPLPEIHAAEPFGLIPPGTPPTAKPLTRKAAALPPLPSFGAIAQAHQLQSRVMGQPPPSKGSGLLATPPMPQSDQPQLPSSAPVSQAQQLLEAQDTDCSPSSHSTQFLQPTEGLHLGRHAPDEPRIPTRQLQGAGGQAATLEADFLESLLETRKLQLKADATAEQLTSTASASTAADAMVSAEKARHGALEQLQKEVPEALKECAALLNHLVTHRTALACLLNAAKVHRRQLAGLPAFHCQETGGSTRMEALGGASLPASLAGLHADVIVATAAQMRSVQEILESLQDKDWRQRHGTVEPPSAYHLDHLQQAAAAQSAVACAQEARLDVILDKLEAAGSLAPGQTNRLCGGKDALPVARMCDSGRSPSLTLDMSPQLSPTWQHSPPIRQHKCNGWQLANAVPITTAFMTRALIAKDASSDVLQARAAATGPLIAANPWRGPSGDALQSAVLAKMAGNDGRFRVATVPLQPGEPSLHQGGLSSNYKCSPHLDKPDDHRSLNASQGKAKSQRSSEVHGAQERSSQGSQPIPVQMPDLCTRPHAQRSSGGPSASLRPTDAFPGEEHAAGQPPRSDQQRSPKRRSSGSIGDTAAASPPRLCTAPTPDEILAANKALAQKVRHPTSGLPPGPSQRQGPPTFVQTGHSKSASGHGPTDSYQAKHDSTTGRSTWGAKQALSLPPSTSSTTSTEALSQFSWSSGPAISKAYSNQPPTFPIAAVAPPAEASRSCSQLAPVSASPLDRLHTARTFSQPASASVAPLPITTSSASFPCWTGPHTASADPSSASPSAVPVPLGTVVGSANIIVEAALPHNFDNNSAAGPIASALPSHTPVPASSTAGSGQPSAPGTLHAPDGNLSMQGLASMGLGGSQTTPPAASAGLPGVMTSLPLHWGSPFTHAVPPATVHSSSEAPAGPQPSFSFSTTSSAKLSPQTGTFFGGPVPTSTSGNLGQQNGPIFGQSGQAASSLPASQETHHPRQAAAFAPGFGQPTAFGQPAKVVQQPTQFGQPVAGVSPATPFGQPASLQQAASAFRGAPPFGCASTSPGTTFGFRGGNLGGTGGFAAAAQRGGGFGGSQAAAGFGSTAPGALSSTTTTGDKWAPRR
eukprot:CAMPEP_0206136190 /NCGR_PEP_ID=MMETSP1473-20131121/1422_1 /ASSEMBLY_ACC=CAM_ASM_001109 /TAXON_ID=1461547 /ORGANISM="Stichococcus sp, Strain RCC1054" /LENGTH=2071 /DNA_ID=CAMNT_0053528535 /DNA_START=130 /DNA_END=6345 /DNA_ORIENTATION=+